MPSSTVAVEELVARLHVGERRVVEHVGDEREEPVADPVQEEHVAALAGEPRAVDDLRLAPQDRREQLGPVLGVVLEVGVLDQHEVAGDVLEPAADRRTLAPVPLVRDTRTVLSRELARARRGCRRCCRRRRPGSRGRPGAPPPACGARSRPRCCARRRPARSPRASGTVPRLSARATVPPVPVVGAGETFAEVDRRMPAEDLLGERDVGPALLGVVGGQRLERDLRRTHR